VSDPHGWNQQRANIIQQRDRAAAEQRSREHAPFQGGQGGTYGAISYDMATSRWGRSWGWATKEEATARARTESGGYDPQVYWASNGYLALATNNFGSPGIATAAKRKAAEKQALAEWPGQGERYKLVICFHSATGKTWEY
jgi:hypothetical protein